MSINDYFAIGKAVVQEVYLNGNGHYIYACLMTQGVCTLQSKAFVFRHNSLNLEMSVDHLLRHNMQLSTVVAGQSFSLGAAEYCDHKDAVRIGDVIEFHLEKAPMITWFDKLNRDLILDVERAMRQRDEFFRTGNSTAAQGGSHDTCTAHILRTHLKKIGIDIPNT